jgi:hypothetical protein
MSAELRAFVIDELDFNADDVHLHDALLALEDVKQLIVDDRMDLQFEP